MNPIRRKENWGSEPRIACHFEKGNDDPEATGSGLFFIQTVSQFRNSQYLAGIGFRGTGLSEEPCSKDFPLPKALKW